MSSRYSINRLTARLALALLGATVVSVSHAAPEIQRFGVTDGILLLYKGDTITSFRMNVDGTTSWYDMAANRSAALGGGIDHGRWFVEGGQTCILKVSTKICFASPQFAGTERIDATLTTSRFMGNSAAPPEPISLVLMRAQ